MNPEMYHPLMFIKSLDDTPKRPRCRRRSFDKRKTTLRARSLPAALDHHPGGACSSTQSKDTFTMQTRYQKRLIDQIYHTKDPLLSESESESESEDGREKRTSKIREATPVALGKDLLDDDLYLSSDSSDCSSDITGASDKGSDGSAEDAVNVEYLCARQKDVCTEEQAYFFIKKAPGKSVYEDFRQASLSDDPETVLTKFKLVCRDYPIEKACIVFANKLKACPFKQCLHFLTVYYPLFETPNVFGQETSNTTFGRIIMTLIFHWHRQNVEVAGKVLKLLCTNLIKSKCWPEKLLSLRPFVDHDFLSQRPALNESSVAYVCCETYFMTGEVDSCLELLLKSLTDASALDPMKPLIKRVLSEWTIKKKKGLMVLFKHILRIQRNGENPIDLAAAYDGVLSVHVASGEAEDVREALELFETVKRTYYFQPAVPPCRGLLIGAAATKEPRSRVRGIFSTCVSQGAYPFFNFESSTITILSSMTKIEIQVYLEEYVRGYLKLVWAHELHLTPLLKFEIAVASSAPIRDYVYPVLSKIREVDHSLEGALFRLYSVIYFYFKIPPDLVVRKYGNGVLMMDSAVLGLFKKILKVDCLEEHRPGSGCPFCEFVRPDKSNSRTDA